MKGMHKTALLLAGLLMSGTGPACQSQKHGKDAGGIERFRKLAVAQIHAENRQSLQQNLQRNLSALLQHNREVYLAQHPAGMEGSAQAASAP